MVTESRTKEAGIRKILGASEWHLIYSWLKEYAILALIAILMAWPLAYMAIRQWLQIFVYRAEISVWPFLGSGIGVLVIMLMAVSTQIIRVVLKNPAEILRYE